jgi:hypothetical protein
VPAPAGCANLFDPAVERRAATADVASELAAARKRVLDEILKTTPAR